MSLKPGTKRAGLASPPVSTSSAQHPPLFSRLAPESKISASFIALSSGFQVHFAAFAAHHASQSHLDIDLARRKVHENNAGKRIEDSLLTYAQISKDETALWLFRIDQGSSETSTLDVQSQEFTGLSVKIHDKFSYAELYPCSATCSVQRIPCPTCLRSCNHSEFSYQSQEDGRSSSRLPFACHFPRGPLRRPLAFFLNALQERTVHDICNNNLVPGIIARRLRNGILWGPGSPSGHWGDGWDQHWKTRSLSFCLFEIALFPSGILIQSHTRPTHFIPFLPSLPLAPGAPINLLPFSTPAYYLNMYLGSTSALVKQFQANLVGLGVGDLLPPMLSIESENSVQFVIAWISVQNKHGEVKGMIVIWPALLCVSLMSMPETPDDPDSTKIFAYNRRPLTYIPELPLALQPSPVPAPAIVPTQPRAFSPHESLVSPSLFTPVGRISFSRETTPATPFPPRSATQPNKAERDPDRHPLARAPSSFSSSATQAFRTLCISQQPSGDLRHVAEGVGKFVDSIAKERERERERIRREKEREASVLNAQVQATIKGVGTPQSPGVVPPTVTSSIMGMLPTGTILDGANSAPGVAQVPSIESGRQALASPPQAQTQQSDVSPNNPSYPSPPEEISKTEQASALRNNSADISQQAHSAPPQGPFDSFDVMDMMDFGVDFNMTLPSSANHQGENIKVDFDSLGVFTDDDFSFFDDPVVPTSKLPAGMPETNALTSEEVLKSLSLPTPGQDGVLEAIAPDSVASLMSIDKSSPWDTSKPRPKAGSDSREHGESVIPELLPGSPGWSIASSNGPATPEIIPATETEASGSGTSPFDPIRFSKRLHSVDAKYATGRFSRSLLENNNSAAQEASLTTLLRMNYDSLTDPRIEIVKKLAGLKRRLVMQGMRLGHPCPPLQVSRSEWESCADDDVSAMDVDSERESDDDDQDLIDFDHIDSISRPSTPLASHLPLGPTLLSTQFQHSLLLPLSVNLRPPGASFSATLDMASPLPNPVPTPVSPAAVVGSRSEKSRALEVLVRAFVLEVIENIPWETAWRASVAGQAPAWRENELEHFDTDCYVAVGQLGHPLDVKTFSSLASVNASSEDDISTKSSLSLRPLEQPMFAVGKADVLVQIMPTALRFWSKMGLTPRSGPKDVTTFVLYEDGSRQLAEVEKWTNRVSYIYGAKGYGNQSPGKSSLCTKDGFVPVRYATFRKSSSSLLDSLGTFASPLVIYTVIPSYLLSFSSPILRQLLQSINRLLSSREDDAVPVCFHFVPDFLLNFKDDIEAMSQLETFVDNVYNRIPRPVDRFMSRTSFDVNKKMRKYFEAPSFTLARSSLPSTTLSFHHPPPELSSVDRGTFLHVGYKLSKCRRWLIAACIDQRGEGHEFGVWYQGEDIDYKQLVSRLWSFLLDFARKASLGWRVAVAKLGTVEEAEISAWATLLNDALSSNDQYPPMHISFLCADEESGWSVLSGESPNLPTQKPPSSNDFPGGKVTGHTHNQVPGQGLGGGAQGQTQLFASMNSTYIIPSLRCPLPSTADHELGTAQFIPEEDDSQPHLPNSECLRPLLSSVLITVSCSSSSERPLLAHAQYVHLLQSCIPIIHRSSDSASVSPLTKTPQENLDDICRNYHELGVLTQARWQHLNLRRSTVLPYHLAVLRVVDSTLEMSDVLNGLE